MTAVHVRLILLFNQRMFRSMEANIGLLQLSISVTSVYNIALAKPTWGDVFDHCLVTDSAVLFNAIGVLGATVMRNKLCLHSAIVHTRAYRRTMEGKQWALL